MNFKKMKNVMLVIGFFAISFSARAVGVYHPPCETEKEDADKSMEDLRKCFNEKFADDSKSDLTKSCADKYSYAASESQKEQSCIKESSLFRDR